MEIKLNETQKVELWKERIKVCEKFAKENFSENAKRWINLYEGKHFKGSVELRDRIVVNYAYAIIKAIIPQIYYQDPYLYVTADKDIITQIPDYKELTQMAEDKLNRTWREIKVKRQMKRILLDMLVMGFGVGKLGYYTETIANTSLETDKEFTELIKNEYPYFLRHSPFDILMDYEAKSIDDRRYTIGIYYLPYNQIKNNEMYKNTKNIKGDYTTSGEEYFKEGNIQPELEHDLKRVKLYEIEDIVEHKIYVVCDEADKFLMEKDNPYKINSNYRFLYVNEVPDKLYPLSDISQIEDLNLELDKTRTQMINHRAKSQRKIIVEDGVLDDESKQALMSGKDLELVIINPDTKDKIMKFDASSLTADFYNMNNVIIDDIHHIGGVGANQMGTEGLTEKTATEASYIQQNANLRNSERLDTLTDYCQDVGNDMLSIINQFSSKEENFIAQRSDGNYYQAYYNKDFLGDIDFNVKIELGSMSKKNNDLERIQMLQLYQMMINTGVINVFEFSKMLMQKYGLSESEINRIMVQQQPMMPQGIMPEQQMGMEQMAAAQPVQTPLGGAVNPNDLLAYIGGQY